VAVDFKFNGAALAGAFEVAGGVLDGFLVVFLFHVYGRERKIWEQGKGEGGC
jgi:hypothetical protein